MQIRTSFNLAFVLASFLFVSLVVLLYGVGRPGWERRCRAGLLTSPTRTHRHVHTLTHTHPYHTNSSRFLFILIHRSNPRTRYGILSLKRSWVHCGLGLCVPVGTDVCWCACVVLCHATPHIQEAAQEAAFLQILAQVRDSARETSLLTITGTA